MAERDGGFTLIEAVIALAILSAGLIAIQRLEAGSVKVAVGAGARERALLAAEAALAAAAAGVQAAGVTVVPWEGTPGLLRLSVAVTPEGGGAPVTLETLVPAAP
jgi:prepilin-type N-terminal cleavage/methylation domain-containing protein